jgi:hypothetical protein
VSRLHEDGDNPLFCEEAYFVHTCCQIPKVDSKEKVALIAATAVDEGRGDISRNIKEIRRLL